MSHRHRARTTRARCYTGPVRVENQISEAHGNVTHESECSCGAVRRTNVNGLHVEQGRWLSPDED